MVAICNGMFAYGGIRPFCATFLNFIGYALGSVRVSALSQFGILFIMTHDSIGLGEGKRDTISHLDPSITASSCYSPPHHSVSSTQSHLLYTLSSTISFYSFFLLLCPPSFFLLPIFYPPNFIIFLPSSLCSNLFPFFLFPPLPLFLFPLHNPLIILSLSFLCFPLLLCSLNPFRRLLHSFMSRLPYPFLFSFSVDGPTHQPVEMLECLRSLPNFYTIRYFQAISHCIVYYSIV